MKIGILTYHRAHNFGAVLQAYALLTTLKNRGHDVEMIDYWPRYRSGQYDLFNWEYYLDGKLPLLARCKYFIKRSASFCERIIRYRKFNVFIESELKISSDHYENGLEIKDIYDAIICGSDQIWRCKKNTGGKFFDEVYFAKYPKRSLAKKIAYAASMGVEDIGETELKELEKNLRNFDYIAVREASLATIVSKLSTKPILQVLDPVFLLSRDQWQRKITIVKRKRYLLFYHLLYCEDAVDLANRVAKDKGLEIIEIRGIVEPFLWASNVYTTAGPIDFISLIANSEYVVSTSFHGVAFAILFEKQFSALGFRNNGSRVYSLLSSMGIEGAFLDITKGSYFDAIDYQKVSVELVKLREKSLEFLTSSLEGQEIVA